MCNLPYLQKHVYKEKMVKQWGPLLCTLILNCCCWLWKCHHQCACSQQDLLLISQHWLLEVTVKWAMWQYSLITMSMLRQCLDVFLINHYFLLTKLSMFIFFLWVALVCHYWSWLEWKNLALQMIFLNVHPNSLDFWGSAYTVVKCAEYPLCLHFWMTFWYKYPCTLLIYFIN